MPRPISIPFNGKCVCGRDDCEFSAGFCHCGCGRKTNIAKFGNSKEGRYAGQPCKYIIGHQGADRTGSTQTGEFKIDGQPCRLIPLTKGQYAIVDAVNFDSLNEFKYFARTDPRSKKIYAARSVRTGKSKSMFYMHREVLSLAHGSPVQADHIEPMLTTDNRLANLRPATGSENNFNRRKQKRNTSGYKGVYWHAHSGLWHAVIVVNGKKISLGYYKTREGAACAYAEAALKYHGEFARFD